MLALLALGTAAALLGRLLAGWRRGFALGAAVLTAVAGIAVLLGPAFRRLVPDPPVPRRAGVPGAFTYGVLFSVATITTSAGPLMLLLTVAAAIGRPTYGALLSLAYAVGRGAPFLALAIFSGQLQRWLARVERLRRPFEIVSGTALVGVAVYFVRIAALGY
ncbi:MAG: thiol:disulfide interchange protein [Gemmatimonadaceae bacterium]